MSFIEISNISTCERCNRVTSALRDNSRVMGMAHSLDGFSMSIKSSAKFKEIEPILTFLIDDSDSTISEVEQDRYEDIRNGEVTGAISVVDVRSTSKK